MKRDKLHSGIGELLTREKYKFIPTGLVSEIIRDFLKAIDEEIEQ